jgi:hypothetical protein
MSDIVGTPPPPNAKHLISAVTHTPATRPDGTNLLIDIGIGPNEATFYCLDEENAGTHTQRQVFFHANEHCWVVFPNNSVFDESSLELTKGGNAIPAHVRSQIHGTKTGCEICVEAPKTAKVAMMANAAAAPLRPPVIVVP